MELGRMAEVDNAKVNNIEKVQKVNTVENDNKIIDNEEHKKVLGSEQVVAKNEVLLDNVHFGYNKASKDFFIKITRAEAEYKYPTEDMMKVKAFLLQEFEALK